MSRAPDFIPSLKCLHLLFPFHYRIMDLFMLHLLSSIFPLNWNHSSSPPQVKYVTRVSSLRAVKTSGEIGVSRAGMDQLSRGRA
jgi:hypothetical protein